MPIPTRQATVSSLPAVSEAQHMLMPNRHLFTSSTLRLDFKVQSIRSASPLSFISASGDNLSREQWKFERLFPVKLGESQTIREPSSQSSIQRVIAVDDFAVTRKPQWTDPIVFRTEEPVRLTVRIHFEFRFFGEVRMFTVKFT